MTSEQGITITIPAGALASETTIAATVVDASGLPARPSGTTPAGPFVELTPHGMQFASPVEVTLPYNSSSSSLTLLRIDDESDTTWEQLTGASFESGTATVEVAHFSILTVVETSGGSTLGSDLVGIYEIDSYQSSPEGLNACDQLTEVSPPQDMLVLFPVLAYNQMDETMAGGFCHSVDSCREVARNGSPQGIGYSFEQGNDQDGWLGFGVATKGRSGDQCMVELQAHNLTSGGDSITVRTDAVDVVFPPDVDGNLATCENADAVASYEPGLPCKHRLRLDATRAADLGSGGTGGSDGTGGSGGTGGAGSSMLIGPEGGAVTGDGITVIIPSGALYEETPIGVSVIDGNGLPPLAIGSPPTALGRVGPFVLLTAPDGTYFSDRVTVIIPYTGVPAAKVLVLQNEYEPHYWQDITPYSTTTFSFQDEAVSWELYGFSHSIITLGLQPCTSNDDCSYYGDFCVKDGCNGPGGCMYERSGCGSGDYRGVCGCDGVTYPDRCDAQSYGGVNSTPGPCECDSVADCDSADPNITCVPFYAVLNGFGIPSCDSRLVCDVPTSGSCDPDPNAPGACCPDRPVCGCDGTTYTCPAASRSVGIAAYSACE